MQTEELAAVFGNALDFRSSDSESGLSESDDGVAPVPIFGLRGTYLVSRRWTANTYLEYFEIDNSNGSGQYIDATISFEYRFLEKTGAGLGYNFVNVEGEDKDQVVALAERLAAVVAEAAT